MAKTDWLSIEEIARLWGEETGRDTSAFKKDLEAWFAQFVKQPPATGSRPLISGADADTTNRLMGLLGARHLERSTFEAFCRERGYAKPRFWFADRGEERGRDRLEPSPAPPSEPTSAPGGRGRSGAPEAADTELAAFQSQIASLGQRLETPKIDFPSFGKPPESTHRDQAAESLARRASPAPPPSPSDSPPPIRPHGGPMPRRGPERPGPDGYRDPSVARQLLRAKATRRTGRLRVVLVAIVAVGFVALSYWGIETAIELADEQRMPNPSETAESTGGGNLADGGLPPAEPIPGTPAGEDQFETTAARTPSQTAEPTAVATDLDMARQQIARLREAVEASDKMVARLQNELAIARQTFDVARQAPPVETSGLTRDQQLAFQALSTEAAMARRELEQARLAAAATGESETQREAALPSGAATSAELDALKQSLEASRRQSTELANALERANAERERLRAALAYAEERAAQADSARLAAAASAEDARTTLANAEQEIDSLRERLKAAFESAGEADGPEEAVLDEGTSQSRTQQTEEDPEGPEIEELHLAADISSDLDQVAALDSTAAQTDARGDSIAPAELLLDPAKHVGREVEVTGSVVWLLRRYRLRSAATPSSMVIDVEGLRPDARTELKKAIDEVGFLGEVRAHIRGTIERQGAENYYLAASELLVVE